MLLIGIKYSKCDLACDVISYCASSFAIRKKLNLAFMINSLYKNLKKRRDGYQTNFYPNFHMKADLRMEFIVWLNEMMQEGALTSFALWHISSKYSSGIIIDVRY